MLLRKGILYIYLLFFRPHSSTSPGLIRGKLTISFKPLSTKCLLSFSSLRVLLFWFPGQKKIGKTRDNFIIAMYPTYFFGNIYRKIDITPPAGNLSSNCFLQEEILPQNPARPEFLLFLPFYRTTQSLFYLLRGKSHFLSSRGGVPAINQPEAGSPSFPRS